MTAVMEEACPPFATCAGTAWNCTVKPEELPRSFCGLYEP